MNRKSSPFVERVNLNDLTMNLIKLELVGYDNKSKPVPMKSEVYINEAFLLGVSKNAKKLADNKYEFCYEAHLTDNRDFDISEECFNRIVGREMDIPEGPEIYSGKERPKRPEINPGHPIKQMF